MTVKTTHHPRCNDACSGDEHFLRDEARADDYEPGSVFLWHDPRYVPETFQVVLTSDGRFRYLRSGLVTGGGTRPMLRDLEPCHIVRGRQP